MYLNNLNHKMKINENLRRLIKIEKEIDKVWDLMKVNFIQFLFIQCLQFLIIKQFTDS